MLLSSNLANTLRRLPPQQGTYFLMHPRKPKETFHKIKNLLFFVIETINHWNVSFACWKVHLIHTDRPSYHYIIGIYALVYIDLCLFLYVSGVCVWGGGMHVSVQANLPKNQQCLLNDEKLPFRNDIYWYRLLIIYIQLIHDIYMLNYLYSFNLFSDG